MGDFKFPCEDVEMWAALHDEWRKLDWDMNAFNSLMTSIVNTCRDGRPRQSKRKLDCSLCEMVQDKKKIEYLLYGRAMRQLWKDEEWKENPEEMMGASII